MRTRTVIAALAAAAFASVSVLGQSSGTYKVPRTPWGEPDLQGIYNGNDLQGIPFQRAQTVGTRTILNDDEFRQRVAQRDQNLANDNSDEFSLDRAESSRRGSARSAARSRRRRTGSKERRTSAASRRFSSIRPMAACRR